MYISVLSSNSKNEKNWHLLFVSSVEITGRSEPKETTCDIFNQHLYGGSQKAPKCIQLTEVRPCKIANKPCYTIKSINGKLFKANSGN